jgi:hypothetical protein
MDFSFSVTDLKVARTAIDLAMQTHMPGVVYRIRVSE